jgi:hypothetical protein
VVGRTAESPSQHASRHRRHDRPALVQGSVALHARRPAPTGDRTLNFGRVPSGRPRSTTLLELALLPALRAADQGVRPAAELLAANNAGPRRKRMGLAILSTASSVVGELIFTVPFAPVFRCRTGTIAAPRSAAEVHPVIEREALQRKPARAPRANLLGWRPGIGGVSHLAPTFLRVRDSFAENGLWVVETRSQKSGFPSEDSAAIRFIAATYREHLPAPSRRALLLARSALSGMPATNSARTARGSDVQPACRTPRR